MCLAAETGPAVVIGGFLSLLFMSSQEMVRYVFFSDDFGGDVDGVMERGGWWSLSAWRLEKEGDGVC